ncbi:MAG: enoyl-CoA hydratase [Burkholderiales bacterium]|jgi:enoyl-CoA hydratase/carnithine racemase|nr:enoyl-CoA hydratase [Burkholderiales bacterium]
MQATTTERPAPPVADAPYVLRHDAGGVTTLTLNRPKALNPLSTSMLAALQTQLDAIEIDASVRVVVIAGAGSAFCAGHDLKEMRAHTDADFHAALFAQCSRFMLTLARMPQPVIARVHGMATAAGCQLVAACDLAVAVDHARFATSGIGVGLFCSTPAVALTRNVPRKVAAEMLFTGEFVDAPTARQFGLVNRVVPAERLDAEVAALAAAIVAKSPLAVATGKRLIWRQIETGVDAAYQMAAQAMVCNMLSDDAMAGVQAFIDKQPMPPWTGR